MWRERSEACTGRILVVVVEDKKDLCEEFGLSIAVGQLSGAHGIRRRSARELCCLRSTVTFWCLTSTFRENDFSTAHRLFDLPHRGNTMLTAGDPIGERAGPGFAYDQILPAIERIITAYLAEAMGYAEAGILPEKTPREVEMPPELIEALDSDPDLAARLALLGVGPQDAIVLYDDSALRSAAMASGIIGK